jgi:hypothetical protein
VPGAPFWRKAVADDYQPLTKEQILSLLIEAKRNSECMQARRAYDRERQRHFDLGEETFPRDPAFWEAFQKNLTIHIRLRSGVDPRENEDQQNEAEHLIAWLFTSILDGSPPPIISFTETKLEAFAQQLFTIMQPSSDREGDKGK